MAQTDMARTVTIVHVMWEFPGVRYQGGCGTCGPLTLDSHFFTTFSETIDLKKHIAENSMVLNCQRLGKVKPDTLVDVRIATSSVEFTPELMVKMYQQGMAAFNKAVERKEDVRRVTVPFGELPDKIAL